MKSVDARADHRDNSRERAIDIVTCRSGGSADGWGAEEERIHR